VEVHGEEPLAGVNSPVSTAPSDSILSLWLTGNLQKFIKIGRSVLLTCLEGILCLFLCSKLASVCKPFPLDRGIEVLGFPSVLWPCDLSNLGFRKFYFL